MEKNENGYPITKRNEMQNDPSVAPGNSCMGRQLAMVYSPENEWRMVYTPQDALCHGTLFEELYKPLDY